MCTSLTLHHGLWQYVEEDASERDATGDAKAKAMIGANLSNAYLGFFKEARSAKGLWEALEALFNHKNMSRRLTLRRELTRLKKKQGESISMYFMRASKLREELAGASRSTHH